MKGKQDNKFIIAGLVVVAILGIYAIATIPKKEVINYDELSEDELSVVVEENINEMEKNELSTMGERDRMEFYVSKFISAVENKSYEEAYGMLYDDFKSNYFPTLAKFEEYAKTKFPSMFSLKHTNFERNGDIYVLWVTMTNPLGSKDSGIEMNFIVKENALNDYVISFSVI